MNRVRLTPAAYRDLQAIQSYIGQTLKNSISAHSVATRIIKSLRLPERHSEAGPSLEALTGYPSDLRMLGCSGYLAFYRIDRDVISVARILNGRQDYMKILFGEEYLN